MHQMLVSTHCMSSTGRHISLQHFLCNRKIDLLTRLQGLAKRIRMRAHFYNSYRYDTNTTQRERPSLAQIKIEEDCLDYNIITRNIVGEIITKVTFLSNRDCIQVADILTRIKKPLHRIKYDHDHGHKLNSNAKTRESDLTPLNIKTEPASLTAEQNKHILPLNHETIAKDSTIRLVVKAQRIVFAQLLKAYNQKVLTKSQRYYLMCMLSRECSLIPLETWTSLTEELKADLGMCSSYLPFEHANLILIYDQICRWIAKRRAKEYYSTTNDRDNYTIPHNRDLTMHPHQRYIHDPFDAQLFHHIISKLAQDLKHLKSDKILKLLYLQTSRGIQQREFFEVAFHLINDRIERQQDGNKIYRMAVSIYHKATIASLCKELKLVPGDQKVMLNYLIENGTIESHSMVPYTEIAVEGPTAVDALQLRAASEIVRSLSIALIALMMRFITNACRHYAMEMSRIKDIIDALAEHKSSDGIVTTIVTRCISKYAIVKDSHNMEKTDVHLCQLKNMLKKVITNIRLNMTLIQHFPRVEQWIYSRQRSKSHIHCYCILIELLVAVMERAAKDEVNTKGHHEQLASLLRKIVSEAQLHQEISEAHINMLKGAWMKLEKI